jgi:hypothetical protein
MFKKIKNRFFMYEPTSQESQFVEIIDSLLKHKDTKIEMTPLTDKYYISNLPLRYDVMVNVNGIQVTNSVFSIAKNLHLKVHAIIIKKIHVAMEKDRAISEERIFKRESNMLEIVIKSLNI